MVRYMGLVDVARVAVPFSAATAGGGLRALSSRRASSTNWSPRSGASSASRRARFAPTKSFCAARASMRSARCRRRRRCRLSSPTRRPDKRDQLVDRLLDAERIRQLLGAAVGRSAARQARWRRGLEGGHVCLHAAGCATAFAQNMPYDQFVRAILTAQGESAENPPVNWYRHVRNTVAQVNDTQPALPRHAHLVRQLPQSSVRADHAGRLLGLTAHSSRGSVSSAGIGNEQSVVVKKDGTREPAAHRPGR